MAFCALCCWKGKEVETNNKVILSAHHAREFSHRELATATSNFAVSKELGHGGFGSVYEGVLEDTRKVAVKKMLKNSTQGYKEFTAEVNIITKLTHTNLVKLFGWCQENDDLLLVYEYMENGSLDLHLYKEKSFLAWGPRYKIALGLASALQYLHKEVDECVLHRDIKPSNIMLDNGLNTKLGDFGLARLVDHDKTAHTMTNVAGTRPYMTPEYFETGKASKKTDVYSFGVVSLEIASGFKPNHSATALIDRIWVPYQADNLLAAVDPHLSDFNEEEIKRLMIVGLWCVQLDPSDRPDISQVIDVFQKKSPEPKIKKIMPQGNPFRSKMSMISESDQYSTSDYKTAQSTMLESTNDVPPVQLSTRPSLPSDILLQGQPSNMPVTRNSATGPLNTWRTV